MRGEIDKLTKEARDKWRNSSEGKDFEKWVSRTPEELLKGGKG